MRRSDRIRPLPTLKFKNMNIETVEQFVESLDPSSSLGYPTFYVCEDGGILSWEAAVEMKERIIEAIKGRELRSNEDKQWNVLAVDINYENNDLRCDHTYKLIPSAHGSDNDDENEQP